MRVPTFLVLAAVGAACHSPTPNADAGSPEDAGVDAGPSQICLPDTVDAGTSSDAGWDGGYDFSCRGRAATRGGQAELVISGVTTRAGFARSAMAGIQVDLLSATGTVLASNTSSDAGTYRLTFDAGCEPVNGEVRATHPSPDAGFYVSYSIPAAPWIRDRSSLEIFMFDTPTSMLVAALAGITITDGGVLALHIADCEGNPVIGAVISTAGDAGVVRYVGAGGLPSSTATATSTSGDALVFNLPGTRVDVTATLDGGLVGTRTVPVHPNAVSGSTIMP